MTESNPISKDLLVPLLYQSGSDPVYPPRLKSLFADPCNFFKLFSAGSLKGSTFTIFAATTGVGILTLPYGFSLVGLYLGVLLFILGYLLSCFTCQALILAAYEAGVKNLFDLGEHCYGKKMRVFVEVSLICNSFGSAVAYLIIVRSLIPQSLALLGVTSQLLTNELFWGVLVTVCVIYPLSLARQASALRYVALVSLLAIMYLSAVVVVQFFLMREGEISQRIMEAPRTPLSPYSVFKAIPIVLFAFSCQSNVLMIYEELQRPTIARGQKFLVRGLGIVLVLYLTVGIFGFLSFYREYEGSQFPGQILSAAYSSGNSSIFVAIISVAVSVAAGTPLCFYPMREALYSLLWKNQAISDSHHFYVTTTAVLLALFTSMVVPGITTAITILGSLCNPIICILPLAFYIKVFDKDWRTIDQVACRVSIATLAISSMASFSLLLA